MEKVVDKATANNYFSVSSAEYISNDVTSMMLRQYRKGCMWGRDGWRKEGAGEEETGKKKLLGAGEEETGKINYCSVYK